MSGDRFILSFRPAAARIALTQRERLVNLALAALLLLAISPAASAFTQAGDEGVIEEKFREIAGLRAEGRYDEAIDLLEAMLRDFPKRDGVLKRVYALLVSTHINREDTASAEAVATKALQRFPGIAPNPDFVGSTVIQLFSEIRRQILGTVIVTTKPDSCNILLDGANKGLSPLWLEYVASGEHVVRARRAGYYDTVDSVMVEAGRRTGLHYSLERVVPTDEAAFKTGVSAGFGIGVPHGDASAFSGAGFAIGGSGWVAIKAVPWLIIRTDIQGVFSGEVDGGMFGSPDSTASYTYETVVAKVSPKVELFRRYGAFEPYIGGGGGPYFVWTLTDIDEQVRGVGRSGTQVIHEMAWGLCGSIGMRVYVTKGFSLDFNTQYDYVPGVETVGPGRETLRYPFRAVTFLLGVSLGRKPN